MGLILLADRELKLTIALTQRNVEEFEKMFWEISEPTSPRFRKFLTFEEITDILAPSDSDIQEVVAWLRSITKFAKLSNWIRCWCFSNHLTSF